MGQKWTQTAPPFPDRVFLGQIGILTVAVLLWTVAKLDLLQTCGRRSNTCCLSSRAADWIKYWKHLWLKAELALCDAAGRSEDCPVLPQFLCSSSWCHCERGSHNPPSDTLTYEASRWCNCEPLSLSVSHRGTFRRGGSTSGSEFTSTEEKLLQSLAPFVWRLPRILQVL